MLVRSPPSPVTAVPASTKILDYSHAAPSGSAGELAPLPASWHYPPAVFPSQFLPCRAQPLGNFFDRRLDRLLGFALFFLPWHTQRPRPFEKLQRKLV